jgi:hypothetical protein
MSDIFLSYAAEDRDRARAVVQALELCGWSVWWDRDIGAGQSYDQAIERVELPLEFRRKQTADLTGWAGEQGHEGFEAVRAAVAAVCGEAVAAAPVPAAGTYHGAIVADSVGGSSSGVTVKIVKLSDRRVRITSDQARLGTVEMDLERIGAAVTRAFVPARESGRISVNAGRVVSRESTLFRSSF